ncbi:MAG: glycerophosphodiester phosphodiesterase family protein [Porticoccus sp.]
MLTDRLVAHRGYPKCFPENTLLGISKAIEAGAHFIETDIQFSADHQPVLYHDTLMDRISGLDNAVHLLNLSELTHLPASEPGRLGGQFNHETVAPLTTLVHLLSAHPELTAFIELKRSGIHLEGIEQAYNIVTEVLKPVTSQCVLISFSDEFIHYAWKKGYPRLGLVLKHPMTKEWNDPEESFIAEIQPEFIFCDTEKVPDGMTLDHIESTVVIYEVEGPEQTIAWFDRGADMVETFDIGGMIKNLAHRAL